MANIAIFRINYKSDFILTLNSDAGWMTPFCIKFWTGAPSQAYFVGYDGETYTHCAPVAGDPTKLEVQFDDHHLPIGDLKFQIGYHFTVADFPTTVEDEVINQAAVIIDQDGTPMQVMLDLNGETAPEIQFSLPAYANEAQRIANEEQRISHEAIRIVNEESRIAAETIRQQNEAQRIAQETARVNEFATLKSQSQAATSAANTAAALANEKAALAADKAALAGAAATLANAKAQLAADKAALAASAAQLANDKAALAQQKAEYAQTQGGYAKDQGDYAKDQGDYAKAQGDTALADHQRAEADHGIAVDDHTLAGNDHTRAESDHGIAADDHTQAGNDHTRAESDHGIAADDHTQAGNDHTRAESDHGIAAGDHTQAGNDHTRAESDHTRAESDHDAVELYVDSLGVFDLSKHNAVGGVLATYADLSAALTALNALDSQYKYGGMSFKFVQTSDNKYVQYRLMSDEFSTDTDEWAICGNEVYVESPEYVEVHTDDEDKVLYGVKNDGDFFFGAGVPNQIQEEIDAEKARAIEVEAAKVDKIPGKGLSTEDFTAAEKAKLGALPTNADLTTTLNTKVEKVEGKSLIDAGYAASHSVVENPEWIDVKTDSEDKILEGIKGDGTKVIALPTEIQGVRQEVIDNPEWIEVKTDIEGKIIEGTTAEGKKVFPAGIEGLNDAIAFSTGEKVYETGIDDEPMENSNNLIRSKGVYKLNSVKSLKLVVSPSIMLMDGDSISLYTDNFSIDTNITEKKCSDVRFSHGGFSSYTKFDKGVYITGNINDATNPHPLDLYFYDNNEVRRGSISNVRVIAANSGDGVTKKVLCIGDSLTDDGRYVAKCANRFSTDDMNVEFVGTKGTGANNDPHREGNSGWNTKAYVTQATFASRVNPFYNPSTDAFDFSYYCTNNNIDPDIVLLALGTNEITVSVGGSTPTIDNFTTYWDAILTSIKSYNPNIKIIIWLCPIPCQMNGTDLIEKIKRMQVVEKLSTKYYGKGYYFLPVYPIIGSYDYNTTELIISANEKYTVCSDILHFGDSGHEKISKVLFALLKYIGSL